MGKLCIRFNLCFVSFHGEGIFLAADFQQTLSLLRRSSGGGEFELEPFGAKVSDNPSPLTSTLDISGWESRPMGFMTFVTLMLVEMNTFVE